MSVKKDLYQNLDLFGDWRRTRKCFCYLELCRFLHECELFYIADEWDNLLERIGRGVSTEDVDLQESSSDSLELRFWASYRGQTLARTGHKFLAYLTCLYFLVSFDMS